MTTTLRPVLTRKGDESSNTGQSGGAVHMSGVSAQNTPATRIWFGKASNEPGFRSLPHHHGEAESGVYVLSGHGRIFFDEGFHEFIDCHEGDFAFIPAFMPHIEVNMSTMEELWWMVCRSPENIVINLPEVADETLEGYRRR